MAKCWPLTRRTPGPCCCNGLARNSVAAADVQLLRGARNEGRAARQREADLKAGAHEETEWQKQTDSAIPSLRTFRRGLELVALKPVKDL
jgi:hypothetical protein